MSSSGSLYLSQMKEFATCKPSEQRYIQRSLAVAENQGEGLLSFGRDGAEKRSIARQRQVYAGLAELKTQIPSDKLTYMPRGFLGKLIEIAAFDLQQSGLKSFSATRFLYERLLGVEVRPWLPSIFCAAAALPQILPDSRQQLFDNIEKAVLVAAGWSMNDTFFTPEWVLADVDHVARKQPLRNQPLRKRFNHAQTSWRPRIERAKKTTLEQTTRLFVDDAKKFMDFPERDQRFIKSSLEAASTSPHVFQHWVRDDPEAKMLSQQRENYQILPLLAAQISGARLAAVDANFMDKAISVAAFDLAQGRLSGFPSFHFLYERLLGPHARPWLASLYVGTVVLPQIRPALREGLVPSIVVNDAASGEYASPRKPVFHPCWVEKEAAPTG